MVQCLLHIIYVHVLKTCCSKHLMILSWMSRRMVMLFNSLIYIYIYDYQWIKVNKAKWIQIWWHISMTCLFINMHVCYVYCYILYTHTITFKKIMSLLLNTQSLSFPSRKLVASSNRFSPKQNSRPLMAGTRCFGTLGTIGWFLGEPAVSFGGVLKLNSAQLRKETFPKGKYSSYHHFLGAILFSGWVREGICFVLYIYMCML